MSGEAPELAAPPPASPPPPRPSNGDAGLDAGDAIVMTEVLAQRRSIDQLAQRLEAVEKKLQEPATKLLLVALALLEAIQLAMKATGKG